MVCSVPGCTHEPFTPSGMPNFACKGRKKNAFDKQERIRQQLKKNEQLAEEAKKQQFNLDKLITIRNNMEKADAIFKVRDYVKSRVDNPDQDILDRISKFEKVTQERNDIKSQTAALSELKKDLDFTVPQLFDSRAKDTFEKIQNALKRFANNSSEPSSAHESNNDVSNDLKTVLAKVKEVISKGDLAIQELMKYVFDTDKGNLKDEALFLADQFNEDIKYFDLAQKYSKSVKRSILRSAKFKVDSFFVCGDAQISKHLIVNYPNVFTSSFKEWKRGNFNDEPPDFHHVSNHRINIIPDISYISGKIIDGKFLILDLPDYSFDNVYQFQVYKKSKTIQFSSFFEYDIMDYFNGPNVILEFSDDLWINEELTYDEMVDKGLSDNENMNPLVTSKL